MDEKIIETASVHVQKSLVHENFLPDPNGMQAQYDIGLLLLKDELEFNSNVQPIKYNQNDSFKNVILYGWGSEDAFVFKPSHFLLAKNMSVIAENMCIEMLSKTITENKKEFYEFCMGKSSCYGDSGGAIVEKNGNVTKLVGIMSRGADDKIDCNKAPSMAVDVGYFFEWIKDGINILLDRI